MKNQKLFVVKKYIWAQSAKAAIRKDRQAPVDECWVDEDWKRGQSKIADAIGFHTVEAE